MEQQEFASIAAAAEYNRNRDRTPIDLIWHTDFALPKHRQDVQLNPFLERLYMNGRLVHPILAGRLGFRLPGFFPESKSIRHSWRLRSGSSIACPDEQEKRGWQDMLFTKPAVQEVLVLPYTSTLI